MPRYCECPFPLRQPDRPKKCGRCLCRLEPEEDPYGSHLRRVAKYVKTLPPCEQPASPRTEQED